MEFEEPRAAACEVEFLAHAHQTPSTTFVRSASRARSARHRGRRQPTRASTPPKPIVLAVGSWRRGKHRRQRRYGLASSRHPRTPSLGLSLALLDTGSLFITTRMILPSLLTSTRATAHPAATTSLIAAVRSR